MIDVVIETAGRPHEKVRAYLKMVVLHIGDRKVAPVNEGTAKLQKYFAGLVQTVRENP